MEDLNTKLREIEHATRLDTGLSRDDWAQCPQAVRFEAMLYFLHKKGVNNENNGQNEA